MSNSNLKPITDLGAYPQKSMSEYEVRKLLEDEFWKLSRAERVQTAAQHDLWRYSFGRLIELKSELEKLEARLHKIEEKE